ncbi:unnamed protein product [Closterium sp. Yama58-4]|nr:unnamed protein product [Closterium sp. Yama58-4]
MAHGVVVRGLAHPLAIEMFHDINMLVEQGEQYKVFGAVPVTPRLRTTLSPPNPKPKTLNPQFHDINMLVEQGEQYKVFGAVPVTPRLRTTLSPPNPKPETLNPQFHDINLLVEQGEQYKVFGAVPVTLGLRATLYPPNPKYESLNPQFHDINMLVEQGEQYKVFGAMPFHDINMLVEQGEQYKVFGAVPVTPANTYKVLANKEAALLFPGGVREALKKRGEEYQLFWPERAEFVRMAAKHEATIIPFACIGVDDGFDILVDPDEMPSVPIIGPMAVEGVQAWPRVRDAAAAGEAAEQFIPPVVVPKGLNRLYFLFQAPIRTKGMSHLLTDKAAAAELYAHVKGEVQDGLRYLLRKREEDPYNVPVSRLVYEATWGGERQAPTFKP